VVSVKELKMLVNADTLDWESIPEKGEKVIPTKMVKR